MKRSGGRIEEALAGARAFEGEYSTADLERSRQRIVAEVTEARWAQIFAQPWDPDLRPATVQPHRWRPWALHEQAAQDLLAVSQKVIKDSEAARRITAFGTSHVDAGGALIFACLLDLAEAEEGAQFWWQFAAGAGNALSAVCLYLLHLRRGELRDAQHWADQIADLEREPSYAPVPHTPVDRTAPAAGITIRYTTPQYDGCVSNDAVKDAVEHLDVDSDEDFGEIPRPSPGLAHQLEVLVGASG